MVKTPITEEWQEGINYELIPDETDENQWRIRILSGDYIESLIQYGSISFADDGVVTFEYELLYSPDPDLTAEDPGLQKAASHIMHSIIISAIEYATKNEQ